MQEADPFVAVLREWIHVFMGRSMHGFVRYSKGTGLSMSQLDAMFHLHFKGGVGVKVKGGVGVKVKGGVGVKDLGDHLGVSIAAASQMLERLVKQHLILRSEDPSDRRVKQLVLTERGLQTIQESIRSREEWMDDLSKILSADEKAKIVTALNILIEKTQQLGDPVVSEI